MNAFKPLTGLLLLLACAEALPQGLDQPPEIAWSVHRGLADVQGVFCHPADPAVAWAATLAGLMKTADEGLSWQAVPAASPEAVGAITALVVCPADENLVVLGTDRKGLFLSTDAGKTFKPLGQAGDKPASDHVAYADFCDSDPSWRTLLVTHGRSATGISITRDLGATWEIVARDRFLGSFAKDGDTIVAAGSMVETEGQVWGIHRSGFDGLRWEECNRGIRPAQAALSLMHPLRFMFSTLGGDILESSDDGNTWQPVAQVGSASWVSLFFTFGSTDSAEVLVGYDPHREGVVLSGRRFRQGSRQAQNQGLYVGPFVRSGAVCQASANGSTFYVVMNGSLWIGRRVPSKTAPAVVQARCLPATMWLETHAARQVETSLHRHIEAVAQGEPPEANVKAIAASHQDFLRRKGALCFTVQAKVEHPKGPGAIKAVTADLTLLGKGRSTEMFDDGQHDDAQPRDGLWACQVPFLPEDFEKLPQGDRRSPLPGRRAVTVTAFDTTGASDHWSAVLAIFRRPEVVSLWPGGRGYRFSDTEAEGPISVREVGKEGVGGGDAVCFAATGPGPWHAAWVMGAGGMNISGRDFLSLYVKGDVNQDVSVHLADRFVLGTDAVDVPHYGRGVPLIAGGYLRQITRDYQKVRIPMRELLPKETLFLRRHAAGIALSAPQGAKPAQYWVDQVQAEP